MAELIGCLYKEIKEFSHIKTSDLQYLLFFFFPKYKTLVLDIKTKTAKKRTVKQKTKDKELFYAGALHM
jgi:hypothetical protein